VRLARLTNPGRDAKNRAARRPPRQRLTLERVTRPYGCLFEGPPADAGAAQRPWGPPAPDRRLPRRDRTDHRTPVSLWLAYLGCPGVLGMRASPSWLRRPRWASQFWTPQIKALDDRYRAATVDDDGHALDHFHGLPGPDPWWWRRHPRILTGDFGQSLRSAGAIGTNPDTKNP
jgi:hypothetical protein